MKFKLEIEMDNAAFEDGHDELGQILSDVSVTIHRQFFAEAIDPIHGDAGNVRDSNGNTVGRWEIVA